MRRDKIICAQKYLVEWFPDGLIITLPISYRFELYLCNPQMKDTIHSFLAAVGVEITRQHVGLGLVGYYYSA
jgi:hypothetical protein